MRASGGGSIVETKLQVPRRRPAAISRDRLVRPAQQLELPAVSVVSAPAGFGKTTLLTEWVAAAREAGAAVGWLSLDRSDSDPSAFWTYVVAAVRRAVPAVGDDALAAATAAAPIEAVVAALVNDLARAGVDLVLVVDDYHLIDSLEVHEAMRFLVEHLPDQVHLVVSGREDPPLPLARLRARGDLLEVRAHDLRFTTDEAALYFDRAPDLALEAQDVHALVVRTEGWIAALQLASISMAGRDDVSSFVSSFAGDDRFVVDYLVDEVLDRQSMAVRTFLLETSVLSRLTPALCDAVTGGSDGEERLFGLERSNLFLVALDDRRRWYRYHHLFRDVLLARLSAEQPELVPELHRRAGRWFASVGDRADAVGHLIAGGDAAAAADLVELEIPELRRARRDATQREWIAALPDDVFVDRPVLAMARIGARMVAGEVAGIGPLLDDVEARIDGDATRLLVQDPNELARVRAQIDMYRAALALLDGDLASAESHASSCMRRSEPDDHVSRGAAAALLGLARWTRGDLAAASDRYASSIAEFRAAGFLSDVLGCSLGLSDVLVGRGLLSDAERTSAAALATVAGDRTLRGTADLHVALAEIHLERDEADAAAQRLRTSLDLEPHLALPQHAYRWRVVEARLRSRAGAHDEALALLRAAEQHHDTDYSPPVRPVGATTARILLAAGDVAGARGWVVAAGVGPDDELSYLREYEHLTLARVLVATGDLDAAEGLLRRLLAEAVAGGRHGSEVEAGVLLAVAGRSAGRVDGAIDALVSALSRAQHERLVAPFRDGGPAVVPLLTEAIRAGRGGSFAEEVRASLSAGPSRPTEPVAGLSTRELDVLRLLRSELTGPEIAAELYVSVNTLRTHTKRIFTKLGVSNRRAAVRRADELGL